MTRPQFIGDDGSTNAIIHDLKGLVGYNESEDVFKILRSTPDGALLVSLEGIAPLLAQMLRAIQYPAYIDRSANQLRAQVTGTVGVSGTVTTSLASTVVSSLTAVDGYQGRQLMLADNAVAWAQVVRGRIT